MVTRVLGASFAKSPWRRCFRSSLPNLNLLRSNTFELVKTYRSKQSINGLKKLAQELQAEQDRGWRTTRYGWECLVCGEENGRDARDCWECGLARA